MEKLFISWMLWVIPIYIHAQTIRGRVINTDEQPLAGASVSWIQGPVGTTTKADGYFSLPKPVSGPSLLVVQFLGHQRDTVAVVDTSFLTIQLATADRTLLEVQVKGQRPGAFIADHLTAKTEIITRTELKKAACCDLAGCFETQASVQPQTTNVVTNAKELRLLGLSGVYNQVLIDGMPLVQGLSYTYGISSIPGTLVDNIFVAKGANSVLQGFESISGQVNVETREPNQAEKLLLNAYVNNFGERHLNANWATKRKLWSNLLSVHTVQPAAKIDRDNDTFLDLPRLTRYMIYDKIKYSEDHNWGWSSRIGIRFVREQRIGGQFNFNPATDQGSTRFYGQTVQLSQPEIWTKTGYRFDDTHKLTVLASGFTQWQNSFFGTTQYTAQQTNVYANGQYEVDWHRHQLKAGVSFRFQDRREVTAFPEASLGRTFGGTYQQTDRIGGLFAENVWNWGDKLSLITGVRADHHQFFGWQITPRGLLKYKPAERTTLRLSAGTGWRVVNLLAENINLLASSRDIILEEQLRPEQAVNFGLNLVHKYQTEQVSGSLSVDFYRTSFRNQVFPDYDRDPTKAYVSNFRGPAISNSFQIESYLLFFERLEWKLAYNYLDVYRIQGEQKQVLPFNPKHKLLATLSFKPKSNRWHLDLNAHWYGQQQLPNTQTNPDGFRGPSQSPPFALINGQFTQTWKRIELYAGAENILDFRQIRPIIGWQQPFSPYFDTSSVWGPTRGRELYTGIRYKIQ